MRKSFPFFFLFLTSLSAAAQGDHLSSGFMRSDLKIYVVVAVLTIIFLGIIVFLFSLERRLKKLEETNQ